MAKPSIVALAIALSILASALGAYHPSAATIITGTDPSGDVMIVSTGSPPPSEVVNAADLVSVMITFTDSSTTAEFEVQGNIPTDLNESGYGIYFLGSIVGTYNGQEAQLFVGVGNVIGYMFYGNAFAIIQDSEGNLLSTYTGNAVSYTVQGNKVVVNIPVGTSSFSPSLSDSIGPSTIVAGIVSPDGTAAGVDELDLSASGSISTGEATPTTTTQQTTTTTTMQPPEYEEDPLKQTPTTDDVTVSLAPPTSSRVTVDPATGMVEVDIQGTGSTSGAAPDHVGVGIITYYRDGNFTYEMFNGDMDWGPDNDPSNGYVFQISYLGATVNLEVTPTGPPENPWATFSYHFYGKMPASAIAVFRTIEDIDRAYVYARAYLDRDETLWNQAYVDLPISAGVGQVTTTTPGGQITTTTTAGGAVTTSPTTTTTAGGGTEAPGEAPSGGIDPMIVVGAVVAIAVIGAVVFMLRRK